MNFYQNVLCTVTEISFSTILFQRALSDCVKDVIISQSLVRSRGLEQLAVLSESSFLKYQEGSLTLRFKSPTLGTRLENSQGFRNLVVITLALSTLVFSFMGNSSSAPQRFFERRNWTPQAMLYLKGARLEALAQRKTLGSLGTHWRDWEQRPPPLERTGPPGGAGRLFPHPNPGSPAASPPGEPPTDGKAISQRFLQDCRYWNRIHRDEYLNVNRIMYIFVSPERRSPNPQLLTFPEAGAVLWAFLQKPQEAGEENFDQTRFLEDRLLKW
uniref:Spexin n=1 Tax=Camelus bactrianus TaxID=9837 RepID=A0A9W3FTD2_CAMBA|nr:spexin [Camelus bactrianus]